MTDVHCNSAELAKQSFALAKSYGAAATSFNDLPTKPKGVALAPFRLLAIHAVELSLNALLLHKDITPAVVRGMQHNLEKRLELAETLGLILRKRTKAHIIALTQSREYLLNRYDANSIANISLISPMTATLREVLGKVEKLLTTP